MVNCSPWYRSLAYMYCGACIYFVLVFFVHRDVIFSCICDHGAEFRRIGKCEETIILIIFIVVHNNFIWLLLIVVLIAALWRMAMTL